MVSLFPIYPEGSLIHLIVLFLIYLKTSVLFSVIAVPISILINSVEAFPSSAHPSHHLSMFLFFFGGIWALNSGLHACKAGTLTLEPHL
jgi:phosphotransferase system  glucose/maltose/N-acetylglucosamine-specific IIC component